MENLNASAQRLLPADMLERWPQVCRVKITFYITTDESFHSHEKKFDEMPLS